MELLKFNTYEDYVKAQLRADKRKSSRIGFNRKEMGEIVKDMYAPKNIMCHGARNGAEVDEFEKVVSDNTQVLGTDLFLKGHSKVIEWDFNKQNEEWIGKFDIIYSNAVDHAVDPVATLKVWLEQLAENGVLAIQWNTSHTKANGGDCFGATLGEYVTLLNSVGEVTKILYIGRTRKGFSVVTLVKKK